MVLFSIICISVILITIQHLLNWSWRKNFNDPDGIIIPIIASIVGTFITIILGFYLITWSIDWFLENEWISVGGEIKPMTGFAFMCLISFFITIQHLINWMWRSLSNPDNVAGFMLLTVVAFLLCIFLEFWIIVWGGELIYKIPFILK